jgi:uncharacterized membrane protein
MHLIVCCFDSLHKAEEVRVSLLSTDREEFENAVVAMRNPDGRLRWTLWRTNEDGPDDETRVVTNMIFNSPPFVSTSLAAVTAECMSEMGISNQFLQDVANRLRPSSSALFIVTKTDEFNKALEHLQKLGQEILQTSLRYDKARWDSSMQTKLNTWYESEQLNAAKDLVKAKIEALKKPVISPAVSEELKQQIEDLMRLRERNGFKRTVLAIIAFIGVWKASVLSETSLGLSAPIWLGGSIIAALLTLYPMVLDPQSYKCTQSLNPAVSRLLILIVYAVVSILFSLILAALKIPQ